jgi:hypothetical protein
MPIAGSPSIAADVVEVPPPTKGSSTTGLRLLPFIARMAANAKRSENAV